MWVHADVSNSIPLAHGSLQAPASLVSDCEGLGSQHLPLYSLILQLQCVHAAVSELPTPACCLWEKLDPLEGSPFAFKYYVWSHFQSHSGQRLCNEVKMLHHILHFIPGAPNLLSDILKFAYIEVHRLCCNVLWVLTHSLCHLSTLTVARRIVSPL